MDTKPANPAINDAQARTWSCFRAMLVVAFRLATTRLNHTGPGQCHESHSKYWVPGSWVQTVQKKGIITLTGE